MKPMKQSAKGDHRMKKLVLGAAFVGVGTVIGALSSNITSGPASTQFAPPIAQSGDAL